jgi:parvulin-like peptidyl-prolyl isomerase
VAAAALGLLCSEFLCRLPVFRDAVGGLFGRGRLLAIVNGTGLYEKDVPEGATPADWVIAEKLRRVSANEAIDWARVDREIALLRGQFGNEKTFARALRSAHLSLSSLRERIADQLRGLQWLQKQIVAGTSFSEQQGRAYYDAHRELFTQPNRFRASHLLLAAHEETAPEVFEAKEKAIDALALRLSRGEPFEALVAEVSEDEASKPRGGDLGFFSAARMSPEFFAEVEKLKAGQTSKPFQSHMGFHIARLTEMKPARLLTFDEARPEIFIGFTNRQRNEITNRLAENLSRSTYSRVSF